MAETIDWPAASGRTYTYWFVDQMQNPSMKQVGGNYVFVTLKTDGWYPVYIGETGNLNDRLTNHPELQGIGFSHDLGGGASLVAGFAKVSKKTVKDLTWREIAQAPSHARREDLMPFTAERNVANVGLSFSF